jgi:hypothetical protein
MDEDGQRHACLQPGSQTKSHGDQHSYSDQVLHRNPSPKANPAPVLGKKEHVRDLAGLITPDDSAFILLPFALLRQFARESSELWH